ncbi:MAG: hypothetical protein LBO66_07515 [Deltaproteobacteria bacterium]|jgi:hypothetical protein|nr:hypothetical protein [Deltaproteobacteria bacterium]
MDIDFLMILALWALWMTLSPRRASRADEGDSSGNGGEAPGTAGKAPGTGGRREVSKDGYFKRILEINLYGALELLGIALSLIKGATGFQTPVNAGQTAYLCHSSASALAQPNALWYIFFDRS